MSLKLNSCNFFLWCDISKSNLYYTHDITPKRVTRGGIHLRYLAQGNAAPKKLRSDGEPLTTLCPILPARESKPRPSAPMSLTTMTT